MTRLLHNKITGVFDPAQLVPQYRAHLVPKVKLSVSYMNFSPQDQLTGAARVDASSDLPSLVARQKS